MKHQETRNRSIAKALSWRVVATILTLIVVLFFTQKFIASVETTIAIAVVSTIAYYFHERVWNRIGWGRK